MDYVARSLKGEQRQTENTDISARGNCGVYAHTVNDFARRMGIGRSTAYLLMKQGKVRPVYIGGRTLIPATEALRLIDGGAS